MMKKYKKWWLLLRRKRRGKTQPRRIVLIDGNGNAVMDGSGKLLVLKG